MGLLLLLLSLPLFPLCGRVVVERGRAGGGSRTWCKYLRLRETARAGTSRFTRIETQGSKRRTGRDTANPSTSPCRMGAHVPPLVDCRQVNTKLSGALKRAIVSSKYGLCLVGVSRWEIMTPNRTPPTCALAGFAQMGLC